MSKDAGLDDLPAIPNGVFCSKDLNDLEFGKKAFDLPLDQFDSKVDQVMEEVKPEIIEEAKELTNNTMDLLFNSMNNL